MPLKKFRRGEFWYVRGTVKQRPCYEAAGTTDETQAEEYRAKREAELYEAALYGDRAVVSFRAAALSYRKAGLHSERTKGYVDALIRHFGVRRIATIKQHAIDQAALRICGPHAKPATRRRTVFTPLVAIMNHGAKRGWCDKPAFDLPRSPKGKTLWLAPSEATILLAEAAPHLRPLLHFILCTGARLSEALELQWSDVDLTEARVIFRDTKSGKDRIARLPQRAVIVLSNLPGRDDHVFRRDDGLPYTDKHRAEGGQIKTGFKAACRRAGLGVWEKRKADRPVFRPAITPHTLRHTWATWFWGASKDAILLRDEGGWHSISMVERYAHLMPGVMVADIATIWGASHPRIGVLPTRAPSVHAVGASEKSA
jgi:integrase